MRATFFMIGQNARSYPSLVRRVVAEGYTIGNHSYSHPNFTTLSTTQQRASMDNATKYISAAIEGGYRPCFFRPPYGSYNSTTINLARNRGMSVVKWSKTPGTGPLRRIAARLSRKRSSLMRPAR